jgi:ATP-dependent RNA helicase DDX51/DBP6
LLKSGQSAIDILVCTPGRLVDHLDNTKGFTLQHLRFLVVDEADRLLNQSYHNWIGRVIDAASEASVNAWHEIEARGDNRLAPVISETQLDNDNYFRSSQVVVQEPITWRRGGTAGDSSDFDANANSYFCPASLACRPVQLRKFLVSATLTRDPQKLAALRLVNPKHFDVHQLNMMASSAAATGSDPNKSKQQQRKHQFSVPVELEEFMVECTAEQKPIVLLSLLLEQWQKSKSKFMPLGHVESNNTYENRRQHNNVIVVFTASVDSTHRLARLLQLIWPSCSKLQEVGGGGNNDEYVGSSSLLGDVVEFSSALSQAERSALIQRCNENSSNNNSSSGSSSSHISVVVCSDSMARGMDIEKCGTVINYDVPTLVKTYLHRVGRTARYGKSS